ncbi:MAG: hypothetical protein JW839_21585 [Candidatus Lokiarchaeota archaeon]|nr:hypothetical protein [Candidatus Lokiarchaeota archaeon]
MDDEEKIYWLKILMGFSCGLLSIVVIPQDLVSQGVAVGWFRFLWLLGTWLGLPIIVVFMLVWIGFLAPPERNPQERPDPDAPRFALRPLGDAKAAFKKLGGPKFALKTGVGAFFFLFLLTSTVTFTLLFP